MLLTAAYRRRAGAAIPRQRRNGVIRISSASEANSARSCRRHASSMARARRTVLRRASTRTRAVTSWRLRAATVSTSRERERGIRRLALR